MNRKIWTVTCGLCRTDGAEGTPVYGVRCRDWAWPDVDTDLAVVQRLADRLNRLQPEPCHYADMVLDYIQERAAADL